MENETLNVTINLDALRNELRVSLQRTISLVSAGLQSIEGIDADNLRLPTNSMTMMYTSSLKFTPEEIKKEYCSWVLANGFRDSIECVGSFLESAHQVLSLWKLFGKQNEITQIKGADWNSIFVDGAKKFHRLGFPDKLEHIKCEHDIGMNARFVDQLLSINGARNCLVHRRGIVSDRDTTSDDKLEVKWTKLQLILQNEDGEKELVFGEIVDKESTVGIRSTDEKKTFNLGTAINFTAKEFSDVTWTFFLFGEDLVSTINAYGIKNGMVTDAAEHA